jgi:folate-dependent phosphoribosylglycinamide formyltransferase PurN
MASTIQSSILLTALSQELVTLVSGLGTEMQLYLAASDSLNRQTNINAALALLDSNDAAVTAYAAAHGLPAPA